MPAKENKSYPSNTEFIDVLLREILLELLERQEEEKALKKRIGWVLAQEEKGIKTKEYAPYLDLDRETGLKKIKERRREFEKRLKKLSHEDLMERYSSFLKMFFTKDSNERIVGSLL